MRHHPTPTRTDNSVPYTCRFRSGSRLVRPRSARCAEPKFFYARSMRIPASRGVAIRAPLCLGGAAYLPFPESKGPAELMNIHEYQAKSEEHTSELQSLMRISYAVFCLKKKTDIYV